MIAAGTRVLRSDRCGVPAGRARTGRKVPPAGHVRRAAQNRAQPRPIFLHSSRRRGVAGNRDRCRKTKPGKHLRLPRAIRREMLRKCLAEGEGFEATRNALGSRCPHRAFPPKLLTFQPVPFDRALNRLYSQGNQMGNPAPKLPPSTQVATRGFRLARMTGETQPVDHLFPSRERFATRPTGREFSPSLHTTDVDANPRGQDNVSEFGRWVSYVLFEIAR